MMKKHDGWPTLLLGLALLAAGLTFYKLAPDPQSAPLRVLPYLGLGLGCGLFGHGLSLLVMERVLRRDPDLARQAEREAKDERNVAIGNAAKAKGFQMMTFAFGALLLFSVLMGADLLLTLVMIAVYLSIHFYALWWRFKLEKEM